MPQIKVSKREYKTVPLEGEVGKATLVITKKAFSAFNINVFGLGDVSAPAKSVDTVAAVFDLAGFTNFCKQIEPHLSIPKYLHAFLEWILAQVKTEIQISEISSGIRIGCPLPFFVKFLGDGLLFLWDCAEMKPARQRNIIRNCCTVCEKYSKEFLPSMKTKFVEPPQSLRCGVAKGTVVSIGGGQDYVGSCINMAARLQKLPGVTFCFNQRGFDFDSDAVPKWFGQQFAIKMVAIRGIGDHELLRVLNSDLSQMDEADRALYIDL
jgi:hypothetical protein